MPDLTTPANVDADVLALPDADTGSIITPARRKPPRPRVSATETKAAVSAVLGLMGRANAAQNPGGSTAASQPKVAASVPSARARAAIETLARLATVERLEAAQLDLKALSKDLFDWAEKPGSTKATKSVVKSVATILLARGEDGVSRYPQAVEMLSFASAVAPLLQPDRLGRLIDAAPSVSSAYAPERYTLGLANLAKSLLGRYQDQRREQLLISLWQAAHEGRFWDVTSAVITVGPAHERNEAEAREAGERVVRDVLGDAVLGTAEADKAILEALVQERLPYSDPTAAMVARLRDTTVARDILESFADANRKGEFLDPDLVVHTSRLPWLHPLQRPETPITWLLRALKEAITPDAETGLALIERLPDRPRTFAELFPQVDATVFPHPNGVQQWDDQTLPGVPNVQIRRVRNAQMLAENRAYMGNCTGLYQSQMQKGTYALFQLWQGEDCYNAAMVVQGGRWSLREINSRFNRGNVPPEVRAGFNELIATTPAPPAAEVARFASDPREFKFGVM